MTTDAAEFPIPADFEGFLQWDKMHCPRPQTPFTEEVFLAKLSDGFSDAMDDYNCPVGLRYTLLNRFAGGFKVSVTKFQARVAEVNAKVNARVIEEANTLIQDIRTLSEDVNAIHAPDAVVTKVLNATQTIFSVQSAQAKAVRFEIDWLSSPSIGRGEIKKPVRLNL